MVIGAVKIGYKGKWNECPQGDCHKQSLPAPCFSSKHGKHCFMSQSIITFLLYSYSPVRTFISCLSRSVKHPSALSLVWTRVCVSDKTLEQSAFFHVLVASHPCKQGMHPGSKLSVVVLTEKHSSSSTCFFSPSLNVLWLHMMVSW